MLVFIDTEFTDLAKPELLSLGMVALNGLEHYGELDLATDVGQAHRKAATEFVREVVLSQWGAVRGSACTEPASSSSACPAGSRPPTVR